MRIALLGYGKTGKLIKEVVEADGIHQLSFIVHYANRAELQSIDKENTDVAIDFTNAEAVMHNISYCLDRQIPLVIGTTGWYGKRSDVESDCLNRDGAIVWGSNFSVGVNVFFELNKFAAALLKKFDSYKPMITEIHHVHKKDAPSGTAKILAEDTAAAMNIEAAGIPIESLREGDVTGLHRIAYKTDNDVITLQHDALTRESFARGAIKAAEWVADKKGFYNFADIFKQL